MRYFYNSWDSAYKSHFGAIARNQSCQFTIRLPEETPGILCVLRGCCA